jgi:hypothetical protein
MDKQNEQPKQPKASKPNATQQLFSPVPAPAETPYEKQPVNQQYFAQPQAAPVQYVVMAPSLKGVKGWLAFFMVILAIDALIYVGVFFNSLLNLSVATSVISAIMAPIIVALSISAVVTINMQKKLGKRLAIATYLVTLLHSVINIIVTNVGAPGNGFDTTTDIVNAISGLTSQVIVSGLLCLYFCASKRVKETLID